MPAHCDISGADSGWTHNTSNPVYHQQRNCVYPETQKTILPMHSQPAPPHLKTHNIKITEHSDANVAENP